MSRPEPVAGGADFVWFEVWGFLGTDRRVSANRNSALPRCRPLSEPRNDHEGLLGKANELIVLGARPDPEPHNVHSMFHGRRPVVQTDPD